MVSRNTIAGCAREEAFASTTRRGVIARTVVKAAGSACTANLTGYVETAAGHQVIFASTPRRGIIVRLVLKS